MSRGTPPGEGLAPIPAAPARVVVLGAGAIGASVGALLHEVGVPVRLVTRGEHGRALARDGVDLRLPGGPRRLAVPTAPTAEATPEDLVILATMGHDSAAAVGSIDPAVPIASFQNGSAPLDMLAARGHPVLAAMVWVPAERRGPGVVALSGSAGPGAVLLGGWPGGRGPWADWLAARLGEAGFRASVEPEIAPWIRAKLLVNLGGIVAALYAEPPPELIAAAQAEARAVFGALGLAFRTPEELAARVGPLTIAPVDGQLRVGGSTRHALLRGQRLETACLHAPIIDGGRACGVPTPVNLELVRQAELAVPDPSPSSWSTDP